MDTRISSNDVFKKPYATKRQCLCPFHTCKIKVSYNPETRIYDTTCKSCESKCWNANKGTYV